MFCPNQSVAALYILVNLREVSFAAILLDQIYLFFFLQAVFAVLVGSPPPLFVVHVFFAVGYLLL